MSVVEAKNICKNYGDVTILNNINIQFEQGEFASIVGKSGSGKSTLLYLMSGLEPATSGEIYIQGSNISKLSERKLSRLRSVEMGFVFQSYNLVQNLTVKDNILCPIAFGGKTCRKNKDNIDELLEQIGLAEKKDAYPSQLSGGQQQRVSIARALINNPKIIFADEPTGNLDSASSHSIMELFKKINEERNTTIIQVTHDLEMVDYGNRVIKVLDGKIIDDSM